MDDPECGPAGDFADTFCSKNFGTGSASADDPSGAADAIIELVTLDNARPKKSFIVHGIGSNGNNPSLLPS
jgi:hypothetical protein